MPYCCSYFPLSVATIHPYYDGNGRTARLLTTLILHLCGYDLKGLYSLEEYYAKNLLGYYRAISIGPSHNYYFGRAESDITDWAEYFTEGMAFAFEKVVAQMIASNQSGEKDHSQSLTHVLDSSLEQIAPFLQKWVLGGFLEIVGASNKARKNISYSNLG